MKGQSIAEYALVFSAVLGALLVMRILLTRAARDVTITTFAPLINRDDLALNNYGREPTFEKAGEPITQSGASGSTTERVDYLRNGTVTHRISGTATTTYYPGVSRGD